MAIGGFGLIGFLLKFIGPLTIAPTIGLTGLSLIPLGTAFAGQMWGISLL